MILTFEVALPLGALAFWLYDNALLLHDNELVFYRAGRTWDATDGSDWVLFGRRVCFPALLAPWATVLRSVWTMPPREEPLPQDWPTDLFERALRPFRVMCTILLVLLLLGLPVTSLAFGSGVLLLGVFAIYYALVLAMLTCLFFRRARFELTNRAFWSLAVDVFACAPFAANLVRRLTLRQVLKGDGFAYASEHLPPIAQQPIIERARQRIELSRP